MPKQSAGVLMYRRGKDQIEVLLVHPGGPFWANKDTHAWSIPKGEFSADEDPLDAARREFAEEIGAAAEGDFIALEPVRQSGGKTVHAFAVEGDFDPNQLKSNTFSIEWPPKSGRQHQFPEVDRAAWFPLEVAPDKIHKGQRPLLGHLRELLKREGEQG